MTTGILIALRRRMGMVRGDERGLAIVAVLAVSAVLTLLLSATAAFTVNQLKQVHNDEDWQASLAAAQSGIDEYVSHLNEDGTYWQFGNASNPYTTGSSITGTGGNAAFTGWVSLPGTVGRGQFRYEINNSQYAGRGLLQIRSSGKVGTQVRTVEAFLRRRSFIDFLYFTDFETKDPALYTGSGEYTPAQAQTNCSKYWYNGRPTGSGQCTDIQFATADTINGPLHTNDAFLACSGNRSGSPNKGPAFMGDTSTSYKPASGKRYREACNNSLTPYFARSGDPKSVDPLTMPPTNGSLKREVNPAYTPTPGCLYSGPTRVVLNNNGTMNVTSPTSTAAANRSQGRCGTGNNLALPQNGVLYVQNVPSPADAYTNASPSPACTASGNRLGYPQEGDVSTYSCTAGDVFVEGTLSGALTIAAENSIIATWHIDYNTGTGANDMLGLIANNYIEVYHPYGKTCLAHSGAACTSWSASSSNLNVSGHSAVFTDVRISAAILSVNHSFRVQNYNSGNALGTLNVTGAIAQRYRGIVGTGGGSGTGFIKNYVYDPRLKYSSPPKFLDPVQSAFGPSQWSELSPAY